MRVINASGISIPDAQVELRRSGFSRIQNTSLCGQTYFDGGVSSASDYELEVQALGYTTQILTGVTISGDSVSTLILAP